MTLTAYRALLQAQGLIGCRALWFDDAYIARIPYRALNALHDALHDACQFERK